MTRWLVRGVLLVVLSFASLNEIWSPDVIPNGLLAWTLLREGDVDYDEFTTPPGMPPPNQRIGPVLIGPEIDRRTYYFRACGASSAVAEAALVRLRSQGGPPPPGPSDRVCSIFPPGAGLLALPVMAPFVALEPVPTLGLATVVRAGHLAAAITEALATLLLWSVLSRFVSVRSALALILLYALGTSVRTISSQALWQHAGVHLAVSAALWLVLREGPVSRSRELLAGVALGLGGVVRQTTVLVAFGVSGLDLRRAALALAGMAVGILPLLFWNGIVFGDALEQGYGAKPFSANDLPSVLYGLLLSPSRGLLVYTPYVVFALASLALAWRRPGLVASRLRGLSLVWVATLLLYASYAEWWGGRVFGPRFLDDLAPVLFAALAWGISQGLLARRAACVAFWVLAGWSLLLFNAAALVYSNERWDLVPANVNDAPQRLFDWSDPQWLAVLRDLGSADLLNVAGALLTAITLGMLLRIELRRPPLASGS